MPLQCRSACLRFVVYEARARRHDCVGVISRGSGSTGRIPKATMFNSAEAQSARERCGEQGP